MERNGKPVTPWQEKLFALAGSPGLGAKIQSILMIDYSPLPPAWRGGEEGYRAYWEGRGQSSSLSHSEARAPAFAAANAHTSSQRKPHQAALCCQSGVFILHH